MTAPLIPTIGLEIHCRLATRTKLFSPCPQAFGGPPNTHTDPFSLGLPGTLPVPCEAAVRMALRLCAALRCTIHRDSRFDRKHYLYPDLPKGYQITQQEAPVGTRGRIPVLPPGAEVCVEIPVERVHLEEDAGKTIHDARTGRALLDFDRAGTPLVEIVTAPAIHRPELAAACLREVRALVRALGICGGDLEKGELRCDANVSLARRGASSSGPRCEIKNVNSFRFLERAIRAEVARQEARYRRGEPVEAATVGYDERRDRVFVMRTKDTEADYRYLPDPDLPPLHVPRTWVEAARRNLPEPPARRTHRLRLSGVPEDLARRIAEDPVLSRLCDRLAAAGCDEAQAARWLAAEVAPAFSRVGRNLSDSPEQARRLAVLLRWRIERCHSTALLRKVLARMAAEGADPERIVEDAAPPSAADVERVARTVVAAAPEAAAAHRAGKDRVLGWWIGQAMARLPGADPQAVRAAILAAISTPEDPGDDP